jgi:hypothetical protein
MVLVKREAALAAATLLFVQARIDTTDFGLNTEC